MIPIINKTYNCFDDGKITRSRLYTVDITEVIKFDEIDNSTLKIWQDQVKRYDHLYSKKTDYFIKYTNGENGEDGIFVRTKDDGWFGLGNWWNSGRLDIDNTLIELLNDKSK